MKRPLLMAVLCMAVLSTSCNKYDDSALWRDVNDLKNRVSQLEDLCTSINANISSLQLIVAALQNNDYITECTELADKSGYRITFAKGNTVTIKHGTDGTDGTDGIDGAKAPFVGIDLYDGVYYWTVTTNGVTTWLGGGTTPALRVTGEDGADGKDGKSAYELAVGKGYTGTLEEWLESLNGEDGANGEDGTNGSDGRSAYESAVEKGYTGTLEEWLLSLKGDNGSNGANGITPVLGVDAEGYWTIDTGGGNGAERLKDINGNDVKAVGADGTNGADGTDGNSLFKSVIVGDVTVTITLNDSETNPTVFVIPLEPDKGELLVINVEKAGTLEPMFTDNQMRTTVRLKITGSINDSDIRAIDDLMLVMEYLDLSETDITALPAGAFSGGDLLSGNRTLKEIAIPCSRFGTNAFYGCRNLRTLRAPGLEMNMNFNNCPRLVNFEFSEGATSLPNVSTKPYKQFKNISICSSIETIEQDALSNQTNLVAIKFAKNSALTTIKGGYTYFGGYVYYGAFQECVNLETVDASECKYLSSIEDYAFRNCSGLKAFKIGATTPPVVGNSSFSGIPGDAVLYVPKGCAGVYAGWGGFANVEEM